MQFRVVVAAVHVHDDLARAVLIAARGFAGYDAALHVVSAFPPAAPPVAGFGAEMGAVAGALTRDAFAGNREARDAEEEALRALAREEAPNAAVVMLDGEAGEAIAAYAATVGADIIVTGSHQRGFWGALFGGARSRELVREAPCGVFLVTKPFAEKMLSFAG